MDSTTPDHLSSTAAPGGRTAALAAWLRAGGRAIGQVRLASVDGGWELRHEDDAGADARELETHTDPAAARDIARFDATGALRPLKGAPTLRRGWRLRVRDLGALREALDGFYPAALGNWVAFTRGEARPVPFRETLHRQTGMYRVTALLTDAQVREVVAATCEYARGCRRRIAWELEAGKPLGCLSREKTDLVPGAGEMPILCLEGCNWLVAKARAWLRRDGAAPS
jgi:hypothetical protein